jgi:hypothetical protein
MLKLSIFDGDTRIATITQDDGSIFIFARSNREWHDMKRLIDSGYKVTSKNSKFLEQVALRAQSFNYNTELTGK